MWLALLDRNLDVIDAPLFIQTCESHLSESCHLIVKFSATDEARTAEGFKAFEKGPGSSISTSGTMVSWNSLKFRNQPCATSRLRR